jgi:hypothetical protein
MSPQAVRARPSERDVRAQDRVVLAPQSCAETGFPTAGERRGRVLSCLEAVRQYPGARTRVAIPFIQVPSARRIGPGVRWGIASAR